MGLSRFWGDDRDLLGLRDVIGHVTIGSAGPDYPTKPEVDPMLRCWDISTWIRGWTDQDPEMHLMTSNLS